jgi:hypothetical protein
MTEAYLQWRYPDPSPHATTSDASFQAPERPQGDLDIKLVAVDLYSLRSEVVVPRRDDQVTAVAVIEAGYLGNSPINPSMAISLKTLELFKIFRQRKPSFSTEAFAKVLCDLYQVRHPPRSIPLPITTFNYLSSGHTVVSGGLR